jgi:hypothetical protein
MKILNIISCSLTLLTGVLMHQPGFAVYQVGDTVSDFILPDAGGNPVSLYDYKGMMVLINFWTYG